MDLIFKRLWYKNFLSTGNSPIELILNANNKTLVVGANGNGKSTFISALTFCLYGKDFRGINKPLLVNSINKKGLEVEVEFSRNNRQYRIRRGIKPNIFEIYEDEKLINQVADARDYQKHLEENILGVDYNTFKQIVVLGSGNYTPFMRLPLGQRREVIENLLDITVFTTMNAILKDKINSLRDEIQTNDNLLTANEDKHKILNQHLEKLEQAEREKTKQIQEEIKVLSAEIEENQNKIEQLSQDLKKVEKKLESLSKIEQAIPLIMNDIKNIKQRIESENEDRQFWTDNSSCPTCKQHIEENHKLTFMTETQVKIDQLISQMTEKNATLVKLQEARKESLFLHDDEKSLDDQISQLKSKNSLNQKIIEKSQQDSQKSQIDKNDLKTAISKISQEISSSLKKKEDLLQKRALFDVAVVLLKDTGIKTRIIQKHIPIINKLVNEFLADMDFYVNFHLDENFNEVIKSRHRDTFSYENFSEGEKQRINLAILFTWREIVKMRNTMSTNLLIFDETFDSSLDEDGAEHLTKLLERMSHLNIFIISHKADLMEKVQNVIRFEKINNFSLVKS